MATLRISDPGVFANMAEADYHADCCPTPSLTQSIVKVLCDRSPRHAWHQHPRLNPLFERDEDKKFDVANVAHLLVLGRGKSLEVIEAPDWRTKAAKEAREYAAAAGKLGVLAHQFERATKMAAAFRQQMEQRGLLDTFDEAHAEVVIAWREGDTWMRSMIDKLAPDCSIVWDLKTTQASAAPHALPGRMADSGWAVQAAMHERGLNALKCGEPGRRRHRFICQEIEEPYMLTVAEISEGAMTMGRKQVEYGVDLWRQCMAIGTHLEAWPGYDAEIVRPEYPGWAETRWLEREMTQDQMRGDGPRISVAAGEYRP